jgi:DsbC/DsbD-like thiol-disulfide interchange protein
MIQSELLPVVEPSRRSVLTALMALPVLLTARAAHAGMSLWSAATHSRLRLVSTGDRESPAAIEIAMNPGFKTYWRHPGDSGVPPVFDFSASENLAGAEVLFPSPIRFPDGAGGFSYGYAGPNVLFPLRIKALDASRPVTLILKADYAVCDKICVPAQGSARLTPGAVDGAMRVAVQRMLQSVPAVRAIGEAGTSGLTLQALQKSGEGERFRALLAPGQDKIFQDKIVDVFVEAEEPWLIETREIKVEGDHTRVELLVVERSKAADCTGADLRFTVVGEKSAIDVRTRLDLALIAP